MRRRLARFVAVGVVVTAADIAVLLGLVAAGLVPPVADAVALVVAASASWVCNRRLTFAAEPRTRWVEQPGAYIRVALLAGVVDVVVLTATTTGRSAGGIGLLGAKAAAIVVAAGIRLVAYRRLLFGVVRGTQRARSPRPPASGAVRLSVVIPAYREAARIPDTVRRLRAELADVAADGGLEVVVVDDGSADGTADAARAAGADTVVEQSRNRGKGAAVRAGVLVASGRTVAFTDADLSYPPAQLRSLLAGVEDGWDVVVGSRRHVETATLVRARRLREITGRAFNLLTFVVLLGRYRDTQCGCKAFRSDAAHLIFSHTRINGFAFDVEVFHLAERYRLTLTEVPVTLESSTASTVRVGLDAARMVRDLGRIRLAAAAGAYDVEIAPRGAPGPAH